METRATARYVRVSPRKARLITNLIKGKDLNEAQQILDYCPRAAARIVGKVLASAAANAENNSKLSPESLLVARAYVDEGPTLKRFRPRALGRATRINKRTSHITVVLDEKILELGVTRRRLRRPKPPAEQEEEKAKVKPEAGEPKKERTAPGKPRTGKAAAGKPAKKPAKKPAGKAAGKKAEGRPAKAASGKVATAAKKAKNKGTGQEKKVDKREG